MNIKEQCQIIPMRHCHIFVDNRTVLTFSLQKDDVEQNASLHNNHS